MVYDNVNVYSPCRGPNDDIHDDDNKEEMFAATLSVALIFQSHIKHLLISDAHQSGFIFF